MIPGVNIWSSSIVNKCIFLMKLFRRHRLCNKIFAGFGIHVLAISTVIVCNLKCCGGDHPFGERTTTIVMVKLYTEFTVSIFLQNIRNNPQGYTVSQHAQPKFKLSSLQTSHVAEFRKVLNEYLCSSLVRVTFWHQTVCCKHVVPSDWNVFM
jgi:hypothetical protein